MTAPTIQKTSNYACILIGVLVCWLTVATSLVEAAIISYFASGNCTGQVTYTTTYPSSSCYVGQGTAGTDLLAIILAGSTIETNVTGVSVDCGESNSTGVTFTLHTIMSCSTFLRTINLADTQEATQFCAVINPSYSFGFECPLTVAPSSAPSKSPVTSKPSKIPSRTPSRTPSSSRPSRSPSRTPTSSRPSHSPSRIPTSSRPSVSPSRSPTKSPTSSKPSHSPSMSPSVSPITSRPSLNPSKAPVTAGPSSAPTFPTPLPTASPSHSPSNAPVGKCKGDFGMQVKPCQRLVSYCKNSPIPMKWTGIGCKIGGAKVGDGGCQCKGYCGFKCPGSCNHDKQCRWDRKRRVCINRRTGVINGGCSRV